MSKITIPPPCPLLLCLVQALLTSTTVNELRAHLNVLVHSIVCDAFTLDFSVMVREELQTVYKIVNLLPILRQ